MSKEKIRYCPFCNGPAALQSCYAPKYRTNFVFVRCLICGSQGKRFTCKDEDELDGWSGEACDSAVLAWNMRAEG